MPKGADGDCAARRVAYRHQRALCPDRRGGRFACLLPTHSRCFLIDNDARRKQGPRHAGRQERGRLSQAEGDIGDTTHLGVDLGHCPER